MLLIKSWYIYINDNINVQLKEQAILQQQNRTYAFVQRAGAAL